MTKKRLEEKIEEIEDLKETHNKVITFKDINHKNELEEEKRKAEKNTRK